MQTTGLTYSGSVIVTYKNKKFITHNNGTKNLFHLLTKVLCNEEYSRKDLPNYFYLLSSSVDAVLATPITSEHTNILRFGIEISKQSKIIEGKYTIEFLGSLTSGNLLNTVTTYEHLTLALVSANQQSILAAVEFSIDSFNVVKSGGQAQLKWVMTIENK